MATGKSTVSEIENPPSSILGILSRLGPGLIIAGSIVGSGELIGTTKTGAQAGFWLLWLIIIGCVIKVFVQVELGRDALVRGKSTMDALNEVPGPKLIGKGNWLVAYWFVMWLAMTAQLGGIAGGVGQAMAITWPLTAEGRAYNAHMDREANAAVQLSLAKSQGVDVAAAQQEMDSLKAARPKPGSDEYWWTVLLSIVTSVLLVIGRYTLIQNATTTLVVAFTLVTVVTVIALQTTATWAIGAQEFLNGLKFQFPPGDSKASLATALKTFGIIGVGASELVAYPYWCLEKGYARFTGPHEDSEAWADRARGWMRVMRWDAWCSMVVYTVATLAFYLLGAAILGRIGLNPSNNELIRTLNVMYEPVFGAWAKMMFLVGAFAVLYSTFFVASAGNARICADALAVIGVADPSKKAIHRRVIILRGIFPLLRLALYMAIGAGPDALVLFSGMVQAIMLPMLAFAALYFRYYKCDRRLAPGVAWDVCLWVTSAGMFVAAAWLLWEVTLPDVVKLISSLSGAGK